MESFGCRKALPVFFGKFDMRHVSYLCLLSYIFSFGCVSIFHHLASWFISFQVFFNLCLFLDWHVLLSHYVLMYIDQDGEWFLQPEEMLVS